MGIPGFFGRWVARVIADAVNKGLPPLTASLSFDLNGVFHDARKTVYGDGNDDPRIRAAIINTPAEQLELEMFNAISAIILNAVQAFQPRDCLILAVDGVAPAAKLQQQRGRREKAALDASPNETFDRNAITPGTTFMINLDQFMVRFIGKYREYLPPKVLYSSHLVPGEGEHKIMDYFRGGEVSDGEAVKEGGVHVIYGLDADLVMLSMLSPVENIYLSRESLTETVSINTIKEYILEHGKRPSSIDDFIVLMFLIGNDFLPHIPALDVIAESVTLLFDIYCNGDFVLTYTQDEEGEHNINWEGMHKFLTAVSTHENRLLSELTTKDVKYPSRFLRAAVVKDSFYPENFRSLWYGNALGPKGPKEFTQTLENIISGYVPTEYDYVLHPEMVPITTISEVTPSRVHGMAFDYFRTMEWIYRYYREGTNAINHDWSYPYYHTPMIVDLAAVSQLVTIITGYQAYPGMVPFTAIHQLVAVLPLKSKPLVPVELHPLYDFNSIIRDLYPDLFIIELDGKNETYEGIPIVPLIDRKRIIEAVAQIVFTPARASLWLPANELRFIRTVDEAERLARTMLDKKRKDEFLARQQRGGFRGRGDGTRGGFRGRGDGTRGGFRGRDDTRGGFRGRDDTRGGFRGRAPTEVITRAPTQQQVIIPVRGAAQPIIQRPPTARTTPIVPRSPTVAATTPIQWKNMPNLI